MYFNPVKIVKTDRWLIDLKDELKKNNCNSSLIVCSIGTIKRLNLFNIFNEKRIFSHFSENPSLVDSNHLLMFLKGKTFDSVVAIGGGSSMDIAKVAMASLSTSSYNLTDLIASRCAYHHKIFSVFIPTTHGTASEVTMWGTIWDKENKKKLSISNKNLYPVIAIIDPSLTLELPLHISISTILDALSHSFEAIWNKNSNKKSTAYAIDSICKILNNIDKFKADTRNLKIREIFCEASVLAGLAFSNTKTAACHSISYPLSMHFNIPHGIAASMTINSVLTFNQNAIENELTLINRRLGLSNLELKDSISNIPKSIIPFNLSGWGVSPDDIQFLANESFTKGRMDNNIVKITIEDVKNFLSEIL